MLTIVSGAKIGKTMCRYKMKMSIDTSYVYSIGAPVASQSLYRSEQWAAYKDLNRNSKRAK